MPARAELRSMSILRSGFICLLLVLISVATADVKDPATLPAPFPPLVPLPAAFTNGSVTALLGDPFQLIATPSNGLLDEALARYRKIMFPHARRIVDRQRVDSRGLWCCSIQELRVLVKSPDAPLDADTDESYVLHVPAPPPACRSGSVLGDPAPGALPPFGLKATIEAPTPFGALRGLETFSQLLDYDFDLKRYAIPHAPWGIKARACRARGPARTRAPAAAVLRRRRGGHAGPPALQAPGAAHRHRAALLAPRDAQGPAPPLPSPPPAPVAPTRRCSLAQPPRAVSVL